MGCKGTCQCQTVRKRFSAIAMVASWFPKPIEANLSEAARKAIEVHLDRAPSVSSAELLASALLAAAERCVGRKPVESLANKKNRGHVDRRRGRLSSGRRR